MTPKRYGPWVRNDFTYHTTVTEVTYLLLRVRIFLLFWTGSSIPLSDKGPDSGMCTTVGAEYLQYRYQFRVLGVFTVLNVPVSSGPTGVSRCSVSPAVFCKVPGNGRCEHPSCPPTGGERLRTVLGRGGRDSTVQSCRCRDRSTVGGCPELEPPETCLSSCVYFCSCGGDVEGRSLESSAFTLSHEDGSNDIWNVLRLCAPDNPLVELFGILSVYHSTIPCLLWLWVSVCW